MKKYLVYIPGSSKWKNAFLKGILIYNDKTEELIIPQSALTFSFNVDDKYEWIHSNKVKNGFSFDIAVEFSNKNKKELKYLVPERI